MKFTKMQGAGNDFIIVDAGDEPSDWPQLAVTLCDRHFGVGADGLLVLLPSDRADFRMRIFNSDGSESTACGNGLRCLFKYFLDARGDGSSNGQMSAETMAGVRKARVHQTNGRIAEIQVGMGEPGIGPDAVPTPAERAGDTFDITSVMNRSITVADRTLDLSLVSMGNPHAVYYSSHPISDFPLSRLGPVVEHHPEFPQGVNFEIVTVRSRGVVEARVWERGVGETLACGSGACAISVAGQLLGLVDKRVDVKLPGGTLNVEWDDGREVFLSGPAETVFAGEWH